MQRPARLALVAAVLLFGCRPSESVRFGVILGDDGAKGAELAASDVNAAGGIQGRRLELKFIPGNTGTTALAALMAAESLAEDAGILAVVGHSNSSASLAASQVYNTKRLPQIAPTSSAPLYSDAGPYSFRMIASDEHQGAYLADFVAGEGYSRPAVLFENDDYGRGLRGAFFRELVAKGISAVYEAPFADGDDFTDAHELATAIAGAKPDVVIWIGRAPELRQLLPELRRLMPNARVVASDGVGDPETLSATNNALVGVAFVRFMDWERPTGALRELTRRYLEATNAEPTDQAALSYDAVMLLAQAAREGAPNREQIRRYLERVGRDDTRFVGASGPVVFDDKGDRTTTYVMDMRASRMPADTGVWTGKPR